MSPETILAWHRRLVARKFDGTKGREGRGRPTIPEELVAMVVKVAEENRTWGYDRIVGAMKNLGHNLSRQSVANVLKRNGPEPAPERGRRTTWKAFIRSHLSVLAATDFFTAEVWDVSRAHHLTTCSSSCGWRSGVFRLWESRAHPMASGWIKSPGA